jgi:hypothetical protein
MTPFVSRNERSNSANERILQPGDELDEFGAGSGLGMQPQQMHPERRLADAGRSGGLRHATDLTMPSSTRSSLGVRNIRPVREIVSAGT